MTTQPDVSGAVLALDRAMIALAVAKSTLLGETLPVDLAAAEASPANPYGSAKHGEYTAPSAAAVAQDVEPERCPAHEPDPWGFRCSLPAEHTGEHCAQDGEGNVVATWPQEPTGHLPQHTGGTHSCTYDGCTVHGAAVTR